MSSDTRAKLARLQKQIAQQRKTLASLEEEQVATELELHSSSNPSIPDLPVEILIQIFNYCLPDISEYEISTQHNAPLLMLHTCRLWRAIALSSPTLWTVFTLSMNDGERWGNAQTLLEMWAQNSRDLPLSVVLCGIDDVDGSPLLPPFLDVLEKFTARIAHLELDLSKKDLSCVDDRDWDFPILKSLVVARTRKLDYYSSLTLRQKAPLLERLEVGHVFVSWLSLPNGQITSFTTRHPSYEAVVNALIHLPNLVYCEVDTTGSDYFRDGFGEVSMDYTPAHRSLKHLSMRNGAGTICVLPILTLPHLETLEMYARDRWVGGNLVDFLDLARPPLRKLVLDIGRGIPQVLENVPSLTDLTLYSPAPDELVSIFEWYCNSTADVEVPFLPELRYVSVHFAQVDRSTVSAVRRLAEYLLEQPVRLYSLRFILPGAPYATWTLPNTVLASLKQVKENGMDVYIGTEMGSLV